VSSLPPASASALLGARYDATQTPLLEELKLRKVYAEERRYLEVERPTEVTLRSALGEVLWTLRPLLYLAALYRYGTRSWTPWLLSLATDALSRRLTLPSRGRLTKSEEAETSRRLLLWAFYLLRSPFFERFLYRSRWLRFP